MRKLFTVIFALFLTTNSSYARFNKIETAIKKSPFYKTSTVAISIRDAKTGKLLYERNSKTLIHSASTLKAFTTPVVLETFGEDYNLSTEFYKKDQNLFIKLSADPFLTVEEIEPAIEKLKNQTINAVYFNSESLIQNKNYGTGWLEDNNVNVFYPRFSAFNINRNLITINISKDGIIKKNIDYPICIKNKLKPSTEKHEITVYKTHEKGIETLVFEGFVNKDETFKIPVDSPDVLFKAYLENLFKKYNVKFSGEYCEVASFDSLEKIYSINRPLKEVVKTTNKISDNLAAETLFLLAGGESEGYPATNTKSMKTLKNFYDKIKVNTENLEIADGCGSSHNNLITADFQTDALTKLQNNWSKFSLYKETLPIAGESGTTLQNRLKELNGKVQTKTGTISGASTICGYIETKTGKKYAFSILIQNYKGSAQKAKELEDEIIRIIYLN